MSGYGMVTLRALSPNPSETVKVAVTVTGSGIKQAIVNELGQNDSDWGGIIGHIPAGTDRLFEVVGQNGDNTASFTGSIQTDIAADSNTSLIVVLLEAVDGPTNGNSPPVINSLSMSANQISPDSLVDLTVTASDPDGTIDSYEWTATAGSFSDSSSSNTTFAAPSTTGLHKITITVEDNDGASSAFQLSIEIQNYYDSDSTVLDLEILNLPKIYGISADPNILNANFLTTSLNVEVVGKPGRFTFLWTKKGGTGCTGSFADTNGDGIAGNEQAAEFTAASSAVASNGTCIFDVAVTEIATKGTAHKKITLYRGPNTIDKHPVVDDSSQSQTTAAWAEPLTFQVSAHDPEGRPLIYEWSVNDGTLGTASNIKEGGTKIGEQITWSPPLCSDVPLIVQVTIEDTPLGNQVVHTFDDVTHSESCDIDWVQDAYFKASNADSNDRFGLDVAAYGDYIAVGAFGESSNSTTIDNTDGSASADDTATESGAIYIFKKDAFGDWSQDAYLKASNSDANHSFGYSLAMDENYLVTKASGQLSNSTTIINTDGVASSDTSLINPGGAVFVFRREPSGDWVQDAYLKPPHIDAGDIFGASVDISGSLIVVGATGEDSSGSTIINTDGTADSGNTSSQSGAAYVFARDGSGDWYLDAFLKASNRHQSDQFGTSVSISGDTIAVSSINEGSATTSIINTDGSASGDYTQPSTGAVYVFKRDGFGDWYQDAYLKASNSAPNVSFGRRIAIGDDVIAVGAFGEESGETGIMNSNGSASGDTSAAGAGAVYLFKRNASGDWYQDAYLKASNAQAGDGFGYSVAVWGDSRVVVGATGEKSPSKTIENTDNLDNAEPPFGAHGAVYVFKRFSNGIWVQDAYLKGSNSQIQDAFGYSVAVSGGTVVVGALVEDSSSSAIDNIDGSASSSYARLNSGAAYVYKLAE